MTPQKRKVNFGLRELSDENMFKIPAKPVFHYGIVKKPNVSPKKYNVRPESKVIVTRPTLKHARVLKGSSIPSYARFTTSTNISRASAAKLKGTPGGRLLLKLERGYKKVPTSTGGTKFVSSRSVTTAKGRVSGTTTNARKQPRVYTGTRADRMLFSRMMNSPTRNNWTNNNNNNAKKK